MSRRHRPSNTAAAGAPHNPSSTAQRWIAMIRRPSASSKLRARGGARRLSPDIIIASAPKQSRSRGGRAGDCLGRCGLATTRGSAVDAAHAEVFDLEELLDAVFGTLAADTAFLHAAERRDLGRDDALVDSDDAVFESLGDAPDAADVAAVEIGGEAEFGVVRHLDRLVFGLEAIERRDRAEGFFAGDHHVGRHIGQHGGLEEAAAERMAMAAERHLGALLQRVLDMRLDLPDPLPVDQWPDHRPLLDALSDFASARAS